MNDFGTDTLTIFHSYIIELNVFKYNCMFACLNWDYKHIEYIPVFMLNVILILYLLTNVQVLYLYIAIYIK